MNEPVASSWVGPDLVALLRKDPWFGSLSSDLEAALLSIAVSRRLPAGQTLFVRGAPPDGIYAVLEGAVRVSGVTEAGKEAILSIVEPPTWFGEIALFDRLPRTHNVTAEAPTRLMFLPLAALQAMLERSPRYWRELGVLMALKLRLAFIGMEDMALLPADLRLARRLLLLAQNAQKATPDAPAVVPISQAQLGLMLGLSRQTTNQVLQGLQDQGVVQVSYGRIDIKDLDKLIALSGVSLAESHVLGLSLPRASQQ